MNAKRVVIVGGNAGGGLLAGRLARIIPKDQVNITVLDKLGRIEFQPSFYLCSPGKQNSRTGLQGFHSNGKGECETS